MSAERDRDDENSEPTSGRPWRLGIAGRLLLYIVLFSTLVTLLLASVQLALEYRRDIATIEQRIDELRRSRLDSIARSLWDVDSELLRRQLEGIHTLPDIEAVSIRETDAGAADAPIHIAIGRPDADAPLHWELPVVYSDFGKQRRIGVLRVEASRDAVLARLYDRALWILGTQAVETFLISLFVLLLVHYMVTRHLVALARIAGTYDVRAPASEFHLRRRGGHGGDELDQVVAALEGMRRNLERAYRDLSESNAELERDIVARRRAEATAERLATHDALTDLPNRRLLFDRIRHELSVSARTHTHGSLLYVDLDHFKALNDARGHSLSDALLVEVSRRLARNMREVDLVARLGGDEFVVVLCSTSESADQAAAAALSAAEQIRAQIAAPIEIDGQTHHLTASVGVALFPADGDEIESLLKQADVAMHHAKTGGRNSVRFFQANLHATLAARHEMELELRAALAEAAFTLEYQPLFDSDAALCGAEALIRWKHPTRGMVPPGEFIPICEESGLIVRLGDWVIDRAAAQIRAWTDAGLMRVSHYVSVNISPHQFGRADFVDNILRACRRHGVDPRQLALEITEGVVLGDLEQTIRTMDALRQHGLRVYIDDFGTGYSSMAYLKRLPMDGLKIDQSFIRDLKQEDNSAAIVEAIIAIGRRFGLVVVAEGVETDAQAQFLRGLGCDLFQGYLLGRPVDPESFRHLYLQRTAKGSGAIGGDPAASSSAG
ncbi:putative bifunctional diguanylate cyclase/phosphodiesterase [Arenimonas sp.]|uniref:putative bifunctional diguanylate cyclase/phosphodiesterase n=1 Tax=Arenimonas sp. TaxID=1872635 RepID=UPI0039E619F5